MSKIVNTDNFGSDYPNESFLNLPNLPEESCKRIVTAINAEFDAHSPRYYIVVDDDYKLKPGFEP